MKKYQYQLVRYIHDRATSEFVNVGIIVFQPETQYLKSKFITKYARITQFFNDINGHYLMSTLRQFEKEVDRIAATANELFFEYKYVSEITNSILPKDDSALECSEISFAIDISPSLALIDLFESKVARYIGDTETDTFHDKNVWSTCYKSYFDKYGITKSLKPHSIKTDNDTLQFDKAWKNGVWHCYQPLSFDLKKLDSIKNKVYKWSGIINELENSNEQINLYFLTISPRKHKTIKKFIDDTLSKKKYKSITVSIVSEKQADKFAKNLGKEIESHTD
jgi:hypothetical protein